MDSNRILIFILWCGCVLLSENAAAQDCKGISTGLIPLADLENSAYSGFTGGKYPNGKNEIPYDHYFNGMQRSGLIIPRNQDGLPDPQNGKVGFLILGFSTAAMTGRTFISICNTQNIDPRLEIAIGAQGGRDINSMTDLNSSYWTVVDSSLHAKNLSSNQVQIIWISTGDIYAASTPFPQHSELQFEKYRLMLNNIKELYPFAQIVFISDRPFSGYIGGENGGPAELAEPTGYYSSWTVKWVIEKQINAIDGFSFEEIPFIDWGPGLWTDGINGNKKGYTWECDDAGNGGIHPSSKGRMKEAAILFLYFKNHPYILHYFN